MKNKKSFSILVVYQSTFDDHLLITVAKMCIFAVVLRTLKLNVSYLYTYAFNCTVYVCLLNTFVYVLTRKKMDMNSPSSQ